MKKSNNITVDTVLVRNDKKFITSPLGDELVMMSMENGSYIGTNEVGTFIWQNLSTPRSVAELVQLLMDTYEISETECSTKTIKHLNDMLLEDMVIIIS